LGGDSSEPSGGANYDVPSAAKVVVSARPAPVNNNNNNGRKTVSLRFNNQEEFPTLAGNNTGRKNLSIQFSRALATGGHDRNNTEKNDAAEKNNSNKNNQPPTKWKVNRLSSRQNITLSTPSDNASGSTATVPSSGRAVESKPRTNPPPAQSSNSTGSSVPKLNFCAIDGKIKITKEAPVPQQTNNNHTTERPNASSKTESGASLKKSSHVTIPVNNNSNAASSKNGKVNSLKGESSNSSKATQSIEEHVLLNVRTKAKKKKNNKLNAADLKGGSAVRKEVENGSGGQEGSSKKAAKIHSDSSESDEGTMLSSESKNEKKNSKNVKKESTPPEPVLSSKSNELISETTTAAKFSLDDFPSIGSSSSKDVKKESGVPTATTGASITVPPGFTVSATQSGVVVPPPGFGPSPTSASSTTSSSSKPPPGFSLTLSSIARPQASDGGTSSSSDNDAVTSTGGGGSILTGVRQPQTYTYTHSPDFQIRNQQLIENVNSMLGSNDDDNDDKFGEFRTLSGHFRQGTASAAEYHSACVRLFGAEKLADIFPELVVLLPDIQKQHELLTAHNKYRANGGARDQVAQVLVCATCQQVVSSRDFRAHVTAHSIDANFPSLTNAAAAPPSLVGPTHTSHFAWVK